MRQVNLLVITAALIFATLLATPSHAQVLTEWVENNPANVPNKIALGYPVPIPVDTPFPFDGFRSYAGLHTRHQDLAATTPYVHPVALGTTHQGRTIWAYRLGDDDFETIYGLPEAATLTNGGTHAREWQNPEVVTGILELMAEHEDDNHFYDYLRDNVNMIVIPSLNIDGFMQTQRFPSTNYLQSDPDNPGTSPRDGRMRRKNMRGVDEILSSTGDHLFGVDPNRNNAPFWNTSNGSSANNRSLVYHGAGPQSEPETRALDLAAQLGPIDRLGLYTDIHSFSLVHFWSQTNNARLSAQTQRVLRFFSAHHQAFPAGKIYVPQAPSNNVGIGTTAEYFSYIYQVPSWTLEVEPSPNGGADYGGAAVNGHDGFILPDSQIRRVREELAQTFAALYYRQSGPPNIQALRYIDVETQAVVFEAEWDGVDERNRELYSKQIQPLQLGREYIFWVGYSKPMRWRVDGEVAAFPGIAPGFLTTELSGTDVGEQSLTTNVLSAQWLDQPGGAPGGYINYEDDALAITLSYAQDATNRFVVDGTVDATVRNLLWDMSGILLDANPATVAYWGDGHWNNYENSDGEDSDFGGQDTTISLQITDEDLPPPFVLEPGVASAWGDLERNGEGFIIEMLANGRAVMVWFTYNDDGGQDWYFAVGEVRGNRIIFPRLLQASGGVFGPGFDPDLVTEEVVGSAKFIWTGCDSGSMDWRIGTRHGRQNLTRLSTLMGLDCGPPRLAPIREEAVFSGSWGDPTHIGEGFLVEILADGGALAFWFSFGPDGKRRWFFGVGRIEAGTLVFDNMLTTVGGIFGKEYNPDDVEELPWGTLEMDLACADGTAVYTSTEDGFGSGQQNLVKITYMDGLDCSP